MKRKDDSLVAKAKASKLTIRKHHSITPAHVELALAWVRDEIGASQVSIGLGHNMGKNCYGILARALKRYLQENDLA